jgi:hypothetical protein
MVARKREAKRSPQFRIAPSESRGSKQNELTNVVRNEVFEKDAEGVRCGEIENSGWLPKEVS